ncbi:MAG TPA: xanthine dehydrogenase family protein subunit M [Chloroflexota bacterium]|jgi:carbon-monoxide dehydrogenase medium subunit|nr:xanthine dehydrogenase family protein subunit M [Chloroflexota bacterium]
MIPAAFEYHAPTSVEEAIALLQRYDGEAKLLAGGHSLLPMLKLRLLQPAALIDLGRVPGLRYIRRENGHFTIGALTTHAEVETAAPLAAAARGLVEAEGLVADVQVRNRGTLCGSLAHADPAGDPPAVAYALDCEFHVQGPRGPRVVPVDEWFVDTLQSALEPDEVLTAVRFPVPPPRTGSAYRKFEQPASHYALVGVAALVTLDEAGAIARCRVGVTGVGPVAYRARGVEEALVGQRPEPAALAEAAERVTEGVEVLGDLHASVPYRSHVARVYARRALAAAVARALGQPDPAD